MSDSLAEKIACRHDPFALNDLLIEAHWAAGVRVRCRKCGKTSYVSKRGRLRPAEENGAKPCLT